LSYLLFLYLQEYETHKLEINDLKKAIEKGEENIEHFKEELNKVKSEVGKLEAETNNVKVRNIQMFITLYVY
jgi:hypothetical protein